MSRNTVKVYHAEGAGRRPCLKCRKSFFSEGNWNRICPSCESHNRRVIQIPVLATRLDRSVHQKGTGRDCE